nr:T-cell receptor alpha chain V region CTL-L17 precursor [Salmo salar]
MLFIWSLIMFSVIGGSYEQTIEPNQHEVYAEVGSNILLSCNYSSAYNLLWYKQSPGPAPQYLLLIPHSTGTEYRDDSLDSRFSGKLNKEKTRVDLEISSAEVTDSALYYCALRPLGSYKIIFGTGTKVIVNSREKHEPSYYTLNSSNTTACLATDFSAHKANSNSEVFNNTEATRVKGDSYYSQVALEKNCTKDGSEKCEANWYFDTDAKINFLSLTILGLRILFLKTIVFNVLMTLRLWMS